MRLPDSASIRGYRMAGSLRRSVVAASCIVTIPIRTADAQKSTAYSLSDLIVLLKAFPPAAVLAAATKQCIKFVADPAADAKLRDAGADADLLIGLRKVCRKLPGAESPNVGRPVDAPTLDGVAHLDTVYADAPIKSPPPPGDALHFATIIAGGSQPGHHYTCGLTKAGAAYCWGDNAWGELGDGTTIPRPAPGEVRGGLVFTALTGGGAFVCGLTADGGAYCWGLNASGQLGDGTRTERLDPVPVQGNLSFAALSAGSVHTCGLTRSGAAYCWGANTRGQLGVGDTLPHLTPTMVRGGIVFTALSTGNIVTCGLARSGAASCWGLNINGELGDGTTANRSAPVAVQGGKVFASLSSGGNYKCGITNAGAAFCWGMSNFGDMGSGADGPRVVPTAVQGGIAFSTVAATRSLYTCGLAKAGAAYCWGRNESGQLGLGDTRSRATPVQVEGGLVFTALTGGGSHTCGLTGEGAAYCWGDNGGGELGDGTTTRRLTPAPVIGPVSVRIAPPSKRRD